MLTTAQVAHRLSSAAASAIQTECDDSFFAAVKIHSYSANQSVSESFCPAHVIWSANRDRPVRENATLYYSQDGNLALRDADRAPVWSTGTAGRSVIAMKLTENGRLVIFDDKNVSVCDSFNYPTD